MHMNKNIVASKNATNDFMIHPDRERLRLRPLKAWRHYRNLVADKEDTEQVFHIVEALTGRALVKDFERFLATSDGQTRLQERAYLPPMLDDHDRLRQLPKNTVGAAYLEFMESQGLTAEGLVMEFEKFAEKNKSYDDQIEWYANRRRDTHDLLHILTGYSRDALGEICVLAFTHGQSPNLGVAFIAHMGVWEVKRFSPKGAPVFKAMRQGLKNGKLAKCIMSEDISALLAEPLDTARDRLGIRPATYYGEIHEMFAQAGMDPYAALT